MNTKTYWILMIVGVIITTAFFIQWHVHHQDSSLMICTLTGACTLAATMMGLICGVPPKPSKDDLNLAVPQAQSCAIAADFAKNAKFALDSIEVKNRIIRSIQEAVTDGRFEFETYITEENFDKYKNEFLAQGFSMKLDMSEVHSFPCEVTNRDRYLMKVKWFKS